MAATTFFLDEVHIKNPLNISGFHLLRQISPITNGNLYDKMGRVDGIENLTFDDPNAVSILSGMQDAFVTEARASFRAERYGREMFSAGIDFASLRVNRKGTIEASLKDIEANVFIQNIEKKYSISTNEVRSFSSEIVYSDLNLTFDKERLKIEQNSTPAHAVIGPIFENSNSSGLIGSILESEDFSGRPFYKNTTGQRMILNASIQIVGEVKLSTSSKFTITICVRDTNGVIFNKIAVSELEMTAGINSFFENEEYSLEIPIDANVSILFEVESPQSSLIITIADSSSIGLSEGDLSNIEIPVKSASTVLSELVFLASDGLLTLAPYEGLSDWYLSPYAAVRGRDSNINISFSELWSDLSSMFCLKMSKKGLGMVVESYAESFDISHSFEITSISDYSIDTDFENLYNSIDAGFDNWKPENDSGVPEKTAPVTFGTSLKSVSSTLDLRVKTLIGSLKILSESYLMRKRPGAANENAGLDQNIFILSSDSSKAFESADSIKNWSKIIGSHHGNLVKTSGDGFYMDSTANIDLTGKETIFEPKKIILSCNLTTEDFNSIGDIITVRDLDKVFLIFVTEGRHYPVNNTESEEGNTAFIGRLLKQ